MTISHKTPEIFLSMPHACSYLPGRTATSMFLDPRQPLDSQQYANFMRLGFRRSGDLIYRPHCRDCNACIPVRIPVNRFQPDRSQRRIWKRNLDLTVAACAPGYQDEHFALYQQYQSARHPGGGMDDSDPKKYLNFLGSRHIDSVFFEIRHAHKLLGVVVTDVLPDGLSAVYTFFDPNEKRRALGVYSVLWQIELAKARSLPWLYLGYWIKECQKMSYKGKYQPLEAFLRGHWVHLDDPETFSAA